MKAVNLIPSDQRRAKASGNVSGGAYGVLGVLAVLLVMAVAYVMTSNSANDRQGKAEQARQEAVAAESQVQAARRLHRLRVDQGAAADLRDGGRADALRLGALHAGALACDAGQQLDPHHERLGVRRHERWKPVQHRTRRFPSLRPTSSAARRASPRSHA